MAMDLQQRIRSKKFSPNEIIAGTREVYETILRESEHLGAGNFTTIHTDDLERLFDLNDEIFFDGGSRNLLGDTPLYFRLSKRMTQAGGMASRREVSDRSGKTVTTEYEIAVSATLLFHTFREGQSPIVMSGIECRNRLEALQRVVEHEMIHLIEMLIWTKSSCSAPRFQSIANRFFGHTDHRHQLMTPRTQAFTKYGIKAGDRVSFRMDGQHYAGFVSRITKRATVLVEDEGGEQYSDGNRYAKFYVPVRLLEPANE